MANTYLRTARLKQGLSQEEVADRLKVARQLVSAWETGFKKPTARVLLPLSKMYGVSPEDILKNTQTDGVEDEEG